MSKRRLKVARVNECMPIGVSEKEEKEDREKERVVTMGVFVCEDVRESERDRKIIV